jgi:hypothetical protein
MDNPQFVWVYEKGRPYTPGDQHLWLYSPCRMSLAKAGAEKDFYAQVNDQGIVDYDSVEKKLEILEQPAQPVIDKIRQQHLINDDEKKILADYIMLLFKRVKYQRNNPNDNWAKVKEETFARLDKEVEELCILHADKPHIVANFQEAYKKTKLGYGDKPTPKLLNDQLFFRYEKMIEGLLEMNWSFAVNNTRSPFVASDNPIYFTRGAGLKKSDLTFPLSKEIALIASWSNLPYAYKPIGEQFVKNINRRTIALAVNHIYAPISAEWITTMANKERYPESELLRI